MNRQLEREREREREKEREDKYNSNLEWFTISITKLQNLIIDRNNAVIL
jgi:hypothetical protein